ncbi:25501_t:CDS:2, partial [Gigaspora rosea]
ETHSGRVTEANITYKHLKFQVINVYAPLNIGKKTSFFNNWFPRIDKGGITILARDFNTNLDPHGNRISRSPPLNDPTRKLFSDLTAEYIDIALATACAKPFITYHQNIRDHLLVVNCISSETPKAKQGDSTKKAGNQLLRAEVIEEVQSITNFS